MHPHAGRSIINFEDGSSTTIYVEDEVRIGTNVAMDPEIQIGMPDKPLKRLVIGDHARLFAGQIAPRSFVCGDYVTIHEGVWCYGRSDVIIGHNAWFGMRCTLDAEGGFAVGNGFGAGQDTHLWSHIRHGDVVQGSRFLSFEPFTAEDDVWFVGRCTSSPAHHERFSVALTESNILRGMSENHVYGGNPAADLTEKIGAPYEDIPLAERAARFQARVDYFRKLWQPAPAFDDVVSTFNVSDRTYRKTNAAIEVQFMRFLLPEAKFIPEDHQRVVD